MNERAAGIRPAGAAARQVRGALARLRRATLAAASAEVPAGAAESELILSLAEMLDAEAVAMVEAEGDDLRVSRLTADARHQDARETLEAELRHAAGEALRRHGREAGVHATPSRLAPGAICAAAALGDGRGALAVLVRPGDDGGAAARGALQMAVFGISALRAGQGAGAAALIPALAALEAGAAPAADPGTLAALLREASGARCVLIGAADGEVRGMSPVSALDPKAPLARQVRETLQRAAVSQDAELQRADDAENGAAAGGSLPAAFGASRTVAFAAGRPDGPRLGALVIEPGPGLRGLDAAGWGLFARGAQAAAAGVRSRSRTARGAGLRRRIPALIALALLIGVMFVPVPDRIRAEALLEPLERRYVAASFGAVIETAPLRPGDIVAAGDVVAELTGEGLLLSRNAAEARRDEAMRRRDAALRAGEVTAAELARLEGEAAAAESDLLDWRIDRLTLRAPVDGIVLSNAYEDSAGAPVREGDLIAEIAPLDRLRVRVEVPAEDLERLDAEEVGKLHLDGVDGAPLPLSDLRPAARAEVSDGRVVLPLEGVIDNPGRRLRPGQRGVALIPSGEARIGEILFRRAWAATRRWWL